MNRWLKRWFPSTKSRTIRNDRRVWPSLEALEDRLAPAVELISIGQPPGTPPNDTSLVNGNSGYEESRVVSFDGRYVVFTSLAANLVPGQVDVNGDNDVFRLDRHTGQMTLISHIGDGVTTGNGRSNNPQISQDGNAIAFRSRSTNLVANFGDNNGASSADVYRWSNGAVALVSGAGGSTTQGANGSSATDTNDLVISGDGSTVVFQSQATNLVADFTDNNQGFQSDIYRWSGGTVTLVSRQAASATAGGSGGHTKAFVSADGTIISFFSTAPDLVANFVDNNAALGEDAYRWVNGTVELISGALGSPTEGANESVRNVSLSDDGSALAFTSRATNLVAGFVPSDATQVYRWSGGVVQLISGREGSPTVASNDANFQPLISGDGATVGWHSDATDLVANFTDNNGGLDDVFVWSDGTLALASGRHGSATEGGNEQSQYVYLNHDGSVVTYRSQATDLVAGFMDNNGSSDDSFVYTAQTVLLASGVGGSTTVGGDGGSGDRYVSGNGAVVVFNSSATNLADGDGDGTFVSDVFAFTAPVTGRVFVDADADGQQDMGESGIPGATIQLFRSDDGILGDADDVFVSSTSSAADGTYTLDGLFNVNLYVKVTTPAGYTFTTANVGPDATDSDVALNGVSGLFTVPLGGTAALDAGLLGTAALTLVSRTPGGTSGNLSSSTDVGPLDQSYTRVASTDGRFVVFESRATDLVAGQVDTNDTEDVFLLDRQTGQVTLISHTGDGKTASQFRSDNPQISADGKVVVFLSQSGDLVTGFSDNNAGGSDLYRWENGMVTLISGVAGSTTMGGNGRSNDPVINGDGSVIAFESEATDLVAGFANNNAGGLDLYRWSNGTVTLISGKEGSATQGSDGSSGDLAISEAGTVIAFLSDASDLVAGFADGNGSLKDVYRWADGVVTLVNGKEGSPTAGAGGFNNAPVISGDGSSIAFDSTATDLVVGFVNNNAGNSDVFRWSNGVTTLISGKEGSPTQGGNGHSSEPSIGGDGSAIAFPSSATDLVAGFVNNNAGNLDIFRWSNGVVTLISGKEGSPTQGGNGGSGDPVISRDGRAVVFESVTTDLVAGFVDNNGTSADAYVWSNGVLRLASGAGGSTTQGGNGFADEVYVSGGGGVVVFVSGSSDLVGSDANGVNDVFAFGLPPLPTSLVVDNPLDEQDGNYTTGNLSLREAVFLANQDADTNAITFAPALSAQTILLTLGQLELTQQGAGAAVTITGPTGGITIQRDAEAAKFRLFDVKGGVHANFAGLTLAGGDLTGLAGGGGAINVGGGATVTVTGSTVTGNKAGGGGAILASSGSTVTVTGSTITGNTASGSGGGLDVNGAMLKVIGSTINGNTSGNDGGGLRAASNSTLEVTDSTVSNNVADFDGGGINASNSNVTITESTISGNSNTGTSGGGGGVRIGGTNTSFITNTTISGNSNNRRGGGVSVEGGTVAITNSTITGNRADSDGSGGGSGGGVSRTGGTLTLSNTIVAGNFVGTGTTADDINGEARANFSLIGTTAGWTMGAGSGDNLVNVNPLLGDLRDNGGPTQTHALLPGSPAINAGSDVAAAALTTDQRGTGFNRFFSTVDIGAFEVPLARVRLAPDPSDAARMALFVEGDATDNVIRIRGTGRPGEVEVTIDGEDFGAFRPTGHIIAEGGAGADEITVSGTNLPSQLYGGPGNDTLTTGGGDDVLLGGDGDDTLKGGNRRDILIGGTGRDTLKGQKGQDILVGGFTPYDATTVAARQALDALMAVWGEGNSGSYEARIVQVRDTGVGSGNSVRLNATTVSDDEAIDELRGSSSGESELPEVRDWFLANEDAQDRDTLLDRRLRETLTDIDPLI